MRKEQSFRGMARLWLADAVHAALSQAGRHAGVRDAYERLLLRVTSRTALLRPARDPRRLGGGTAAHAGLLALALHHADWLRPVEAWGPAPTNFTPLFASLATHLLALYPVPACMTSAWFLVPPRGWRSY